MTDPITLHIAEQSAFRHALESAVAIRMARRYRDIYPVLDHVRVTGCAGDQTVMVWATDRFIILQVEVDLSEPLSGPVDLLIPMDYVATLTRQLAKKPVPCELTAYEVNSVSLTLNTFDSQTSVPAGIGNFPRVAHIIEQAGRPLDENIENFQSHALGPEVMAKLAKIKPHPEDSGTDPGSLFIRWGDRRKPAFFQSGQTGKIVGSFMPFSHTLIPER